MSRPENSIKVTCEKTGECLAYLTPDRTGKNIWDTFFFVYNGYKSGPFGCRDALFEVPEDKYVEDIEYSSDGGHKHTIHLKSY